MLFLVYVSSATVPFSDADLVELLRVSRNNNSRLDVTGMLLHKDGNFMQVLEGPEDAVRRLYGTISADERHRRVLELLERTVEQRQFAEWTMAFKNLNDPATHEIPGYSEFMNESLTSENLRTNPNRARQLLTTFRRYMGT